MMKYYLAIALLLGAGIMVGCKKAEEPAATPAAAPSEPAAPAETPPAEEPAKQ